MQQERLGNAVALTAELYTNYTHGPVEERTPIPDLNLDGDRGFAYPTWAAREECTIKDGIQALGFDLTERKRLGDTVTPREAR